MAKTYADWTQGSNNSSSPRRIVITRLNTNFDDWKALANAELIRGGIDTNLPSKLSILHAWENDSTPYSFANEWSDRVRRSKNRLSVKEI